MHESSGGVARKMLLGARLYVLWFITAGLGLVDVVVAWPVIKAGAALGLSGWGPAAAKWFTPLLIGVGLIIGAVWLVLILLCEDRYRTEAAIGTGRLLRRFAWVTGAEVGLLALALVAGLLLARLD